MKVMSMSHPQYVKTGICEKYQTLLEECERALAIWNEHRAEVAKSPVIAREAGDELVRLQAKYARAYTVLQNHTRLCTFCQLVKSLEERRSENSSHAVFDDARYR